MNTPEDLLRHSALPLGDELHHLPEARRCAQERRLADPDLLGRESGRRAGNDSRGGAASAVADGTRILKEWGGITHEIQITGDGGAVWNGQSYSSLSAVARAMTGTNRNGPKFFGLREGDNK